MLQGKNDRLFSRKKHANQQWHTRRLPTGSRLIRLVACALSFKRQGVDKLAGHLFPHSVVADFGAGKGAYCHFLLDRTPCTIIALDWSAEALQTIPPPAQGSIFRVCADLHHLPLKPARIDACYSIDTLGHLRKQELALSEIVRICRGNAALFLHSECADYQRHWPNHALIRRTGFDPIAAIDGHVGIRSANAMHVLYEQCFSLASFFSPAGVFGWLIGYPEKYTAAFKKAGMLPLYLATLFFTIIKKIPLSGFLLRLINMCSNQCELTIGLTGGGSCFATGHTTTIAALTTPEDSRGIDIIIPTFNRIALLPALVTSLIEQAGTADTITLVMQGDTSPYAFNDSRIRSIHTPHPNLPHARNTGLRAGGNPLVLFLDDDVTVAPHLLLAHRRCYHNPKIGAVAGSIADPLFPKATVAPSQFNAKTGELVQNFSYPVSGKTISFMGAHMSFRRDALETVGEFDTAYSHNALWEEIDVAFRLQQKGYSIYYCREALITHLRQPQGGCRADSGSTYLFHQFANTGYFTCTFAPLPYLCNWLIFQKHRLEYCSRTPTATPLLRHNPRLVIAGIAGITAGFVRFWLSGTRRGLPPAVAGNCPAEEVRTL